MDGNKWMMDDHVTHIMLCTQCNAFTMAMEWLMANMDGCDDGHTMGGLHRRKFRQKFLVG